ncbi:MAG: hypothetical protein E6J89_09805 [Deltaproteobacteria bacterium]|nr:MAG: hypothetical protein E6J89_09805 [Deltaproteobacteria bacterium]
MSFESVRRALLWCALLNYGILVVWFLFFMLAHDWMYLFHSRWFHISVEQFDLLHYAGMSIYKIGILLFNLVPFVALHIVDKSRSS